MTPLLIACVIKFIWHLIHDAANRFCYQFHCHSFIHGSMTLRIACVIHFNCHFLGQNTRTITISSIDIHCRELNTNNTDTKKKKKNKLYLNTGASDDAHEKVRNNTGDCHHKALHTSDASKEHEHKVNKVVPTRMQLHHEVNNWTWYNGYQEQKRKGWERIPNDKRRHSIVPIQPLPTKYLQNKQNWKPPSLVIAS